MEALYGRARSEMEAVLGRGELLAEMKDLPEKDTILKVDLAGRDPDDAFSNVPYEKGYLFLRTIEEAFGRERFDALSYTHRKEWARGVEEAKAEATRQRRIAKCVETLTSD